MGFNRKEFLRIFVSVFTLGVAVALVGTSEGELLQMIVGFTIGAIGVALIVNS